MTASAEARVRAALNARAQSTLVREFQFSAMESTTTNLHGRRWPRSTMLVAAALLLLAGVIGLIRLVPTEVRPASDRAMSEELRPALLIAQPLVAGTMTDSSIALANEVNGLVSQQLPGFSVVENERRSAEGMTLDWVYVTGEASRLFFAVGDRAVMDDVINRVTPIGTTPEFDLYAWPDRTWNRTVAAVSGTTVLIVDSEAFTIDGEALSEDMLIQLVEALALRVGLA